MLRQKASGRPRNDRATAAILRAALALGVERDFQGVTMEGIAERAGVGKTTIYRRWPDVWTVVLEAVMAEITQVSPVLERMTARESFSVSMKLVAKAFRGKTGKLLRPLLGRAQVRRRPARCDRRTLAARAAKELARDRAACHRKR